MAEGSKSPDNSNREALFYTAAAAVAAALVALPSLTLATIAYWFTRNKVRRSEYLIVLAATTAVFVFGAADMTVTYLSWVWAVLSFGDAPVFPPPIVEIVNLAGFLFATIGLLSGSKLARKAVDRSGGLRKLLGKASSPFGDKATIVPDERLRNQAKIASPTGGLLAPRPTDHSVMTPDEFGKRQIAIGHDQHKRPVMLSEHELGMHGLFLGSTGSGKALALDTKIPTPTGFTTMGDLVVGDEIFDEAGQVCKVTFATGIQLDRPCYEVRFDDGTVIVADADHRWLTTMRTDATECGTVVDTAVRTTIEILSTLRGLDGVPNHSIGAAAPLALAAADLPNDPYLIGVTLGAPATAATAIAAATGDPADRIAPGYLRGSVDQRADLLQGIIDGAGVVTDTGWVEITVAAEPLARDVAHLAATLAFTPQLRPGTSSWTVGFAVDPGVARRGRRTCSLTDVAAPSNSSRSIVDVVQVPSVPVRCIQVDSPSHLFLAGETCIPTHNTETIKSFAAALLDLGWDGMVLDLKEDTTTGGLRDFLEHYAMSHALPYQQLALSDAQPAFWFNPLAQMGPDEARDTILSLSEFDDQFWQNVNKKVLGQLVTLVYAAHEIDPVQFPYPTMYEVGKILGSGNLPASTKAMRAVVVATQSGLTTDDFSALGAPSQDEAKSAVGFGAKLTQIYETQAGRIVLRGGGNRPFIDVTAPGLTYIGLDTQGKADMSKMVSSAVLQRMSVYAAQRTTGAMAKGKPRFLIVDEANWVHRQIVKNLLSRARSAGIMLVLATQGPDDWIDRNGDDWSVMSQNVNFGVIMAQGSPQAAQLCAEWLGQHEVTSASAQFRDGQLVDSGSVRESIDFLVPPHELRRLSQGEAFFRINKPDERVGWMSVKMRDPKAQLGG